MSLVLELPWSRSGTLISELDKIAVVVLYANPDKTLKEIASAVGMLPDKLRRLCKLKAGQTVYEIAASSGNPESLTEYHISKEYPVPKAVLDERTRQIEGAKNYKSSVPKKTPIKLILCAADLGEVKPLFSDDDDDDEI